MAETRAQYFTPREFGARASEMQVNYLPIAQYNTDEQIHVIEELLREVLYTCIDVPENLKDRIRASLGIEEKLKIEPSVNR